MTNKDKTIGDDGQNDSFDGDFESVPGGGDDIELVEASPEDTLEATQDLQMDSFEDLDSSLVREDEVADIFDDSDDAIGYEGAQPSISSDSDPLAFSEQITLEGQVEAILFASPKPMKSSDILDILQDEEHSYQLSQIEEVVSNLHQLYEERAGGFTLVHEKGLGYQFQTVVAASHLMERMFSSRPRPLSRAALETLSIIAYRQPATRAEIEYVRGVDAGSIIKNLLDRELIKCVGRKEDAGRPMLFGTTPEFLKVFKLSTLDELPPLASFQPPSETLESSQFEIRDSVDVEEFVGDEDHEQPAISLGLDDIDSNDLDALAEIAMVGSDEQEAEEVQIDRASESLWEQEGDLTGPSDDKGLDTPIEPTIETLQKVGATQFDTKETEDTDDRDQNTKTPVPTGDNVEKGS